MTKLPLPAAPDVLYLVDLSGYLFRAYHAIHPLSSPSGEPTHATYGTVTMLQKLVDAQRPALFAVAMDSRTRTFRMDIDAAYKAHRPPPPPDLSQQMERSREIVEAWGIPIFQRDGVEADDLIASVVPRALAAGLDVVIVSADKDLMQLVGPRVLMWDTMRDKAYGADDVREKFGVPPEQMRDLLALMGDSSDNVPGVPGVGPKTAAELLHSFGTIDGVYEHLADVARPKLRAALESHEADARRSRELVTLRADEPLEFDVEKLRWGGADVPRLRALYGELGFTRLASALPAPATATAEEAPIDGQAPAAGLAVRVVTTRDELAALALDAQRLGQLALAVETTTGSSMRAALVGLALATAPGEAAYVPLGHRYIGAPTQLSLATLVEVFAPVLADARVTKVGHDLKFADVALGRVGLRLDGPSFDVMLASYLLDPEADHALPRLSERTLRVALPSIEERPARARAPKLDRDELPIDVVAPVAAARADAARALVPKLQAELASAGLAALLADLEAPLARVLADMERAGVLVDLGQLGRLATLVDGELATLEKRAHDAAGHAFNVASPRQLEVVLFDELGLRSTKRTKTARSTDADVLEALSDAHPLAAIVLEHRQLAKLKGTYIDTLPALVHPQTGRIHTQWSQAVAATGRISSNDPNLQNIPVRSEVGRAIRSAFIAPPGCVLVAADYSQIELRVLAHLSGDPVLVEAFRTGQDIHARTAMELFGVAEPDVTDEMRRRAKTINFGVIYGMGEVALAKRLGIPRTEAASFIERYFVRYAGVRAYLDATLAEAQRSEAVRTMLGRRRLVRDLGSSNSMLRSAAERIATNTPIQGTAADLLKLAMLRLAAPVVPGARMVLTVHDELVFEVPEARVEEAEARVREAMESVAELAVPLVVDVVRGASWT